MVEAQHPAEPLAHSIALIVDLCFELPDQVGDCLAVELPAHPCLIERGVVHEAVSSVTDMFARGVGESRGFGLGHDKGSGEGTLPWLVNRLDIMD